MGINVFPPASGAAGGNFVVDMNDTTNNVTTLDSPKGAGTYNVSLASGDSSFDIYLINSSGASVGYSNSGSITASEDFSSVVVLGVSSTEIISFAFSGVVSNPNAEGSVPGAGAYLTSITPSDLPGIDDTTTVTGGNFGANTEITFESGPTVLSAKNIVVTNQNELIVTRPDNLVEDDAPYTLRAINTDVTPPTGSNAHILTNAVTAGADPTWVTTSPLNTFPPNEAFSQTLEATDADGTVTDYSVTAGTLTPGLSLDSSTGVLSGTPTTEGTFTFTVTATDDGGNSTDKVFTQTIEVPSGQELFTTSGIFTVPTGVSSISVVCVGAGGGGWVSTGSERAFSGGGGGLSYASSISVSQGQTYSVQVGAGNFAGAGGDSVFPGLIGEGGGKEGFGTSGGDSLGSLRTGGGSGGNGTASAGYPDYQGGGGAGGYSGNGGSGSACCSSFGGTATDGQGGGGAGAGGYFDGNSDFDERRGGGGGVGVFGEGSNGIAPRGGGSGGTSGNRDSTPGVYGGGGGADYIDNIRSTGGNGAVRIIWGPGRSYPSTNTGDV